MAAASLRMASEKLKSGEEFDFQMKAMNSENDLALFGAKPLFKEPLHVGRPSIGDRKRLHERLDEILDRNWLSNNGPLVQEFESALAKRLGVKHCISVCNGTVALELAIRALDLKGEVIIPSFTFVATAHALQWQEITPVFADIDPKTHSLAPEAVERMITPRTSGIIGVHIWGRPCDVEGLSSMASKHGLKLMFDASHAFGSTCGGVPIGSFGSCEVFSFHATKILNAFEGGAIATSDDKLAEKLRLMKNFGFKGYDNVIYIGTNGKMSEISAAMGLTNLESLDEFVAANRRNWELYSSELDGVPGLSVIDYDLKEQNNFQYAVVEVDEAAFGLSRDQAVAALHAENVLARRYFYPGCHRMMPYRALFPHAELLLPETVKVMNRVLVLPTGVNVSPEDARGVAEVLKLLHAGAGRVGERLKAIGGA